MSWVQVALECDCCGARSDPLPDQCVLPSGWVGSGYYGTKPPSYSFGVNVQSMMNHVSFAHLCPTCASFSIKELVSQAIRKLQAVQ